MLQDLTLSQVVESSITCKASDDGFYYVGKPAQRFQPLARKFCGHRGLVGKEGGPYSQQTYMPVGPKDYRADWRLRSLKKTANYILKPMMHTGQ